MKIANTPKQRADLFREWARIIELAAEHKSKVGSLIKVDGLSWGDCNPPKFDVLYNLCSFAQGVVEGKPVFIGDTLWSNSFSQFVTVSGHILVDKVHFLTLESIRPLVDNCTWKKPEPTCYIFGKVLPVPVGGIPLALELNFNLTTLFDLLNRGSITWDKPEDRKEWIDLLADLLK